MEERLQKYMARCGVASRRKCEELIADGLVEINGETVREPGVKIDPARDRIRVDGKALHVEKPAYYIHYKVKGVTTTVSDDLGRKTVMDCLPDIRERVYPVGRLDKESEGLLVLTNDGELANYLTHPAHGVGKTYRVVAEGRVPEETLRALSEKGIRLGPVLIKPSRVELVRYDEASTIVLISVSEGINREVRRIFAALGHEVKKLLRTQVGPLALAGLKRGATRPLTQKEVAVLRKGMAGIDVAAEAERFPAGSAGGRKPTGPRGRPRREKAERRGKPDPAAAAAGKKFAAKPSRQPGRGPGRGKVVVDDWKKTVTIGARARRGRVAAKGTDAAAEPKKLRTLRPVKGTVGRPSSAPAKQVQQAKPEKPVRVISHPLFAKPGKPAKPGQFAGAKRRGNANGKGGTRHG
jgi:pseudouridine synthase